MTDRIAQHAEPKTPVEGQRLELPKFHVLCKAISPETRAEPVDRMAYQ